jgi:hypothetical protein
MVKPYVPSVVGVQSLAESEADPALAAFLNLLGRDVATRPEAFVVLTPELALRVMAATAGVAADADLPIEGEVAL